MGAPIFWEVALLPLEEHEGKLMVVVRQWERPDESEVKSTRLDSGSTIIHGPYSFCGGLTRVIKISDSKKVLRCERCGLRISFPSSVETVGELLEYLSSG